MDDLSGSTRAADRRSRRGIVMMAMLRLPTQRRRWKKPWSRVSHVHVKVTCRLSCWRLTSLLKRSIRSAHKKNSPRASAFRGSSASPIQRACHPTETNRCFCSTDVRDMVQLGDKSSCGQSGGLYQSASAQSCLVGRFVQRAMCKCMQVCCYRASCMFACSHVRLSFLVGIKVGHFVYELSRATTLVILLIRVHNQVDKYAVPDGNGQKFGSGG